MTVLPDSIPPRLHDWRPRLTEYVIAARARAFRPGAFDCALFAAGAIEAMTGIDPAASWRGGYRTLEDGEALLRSQGYTDHVDAVAALLEEVPPALARAGDMAVVETDEGAALGVVQGAGIYVVTPAGGLGVVDRLRAVRAFRV